jgi:hypothetical protein
MRNCWFVGILFLVVPVPVSASEFCADMIDGFAAQMDRIAGSYESMKSRKEVCDFGRNTTVPTAKKILATVQANQEKCKDGAAAVKFAQGSLQGWIKKTDQACRDAGM